MNLVALPAFADNYIWMLHDGAKAVVVDPGDAAPVRAALEAHGLVLAAILVTHHHPDHVGGIADLRPHLQGPVFGPAREKIPGPFTPLHDCDTIQVIGLHFTVLDVPGHTAGHIAYLQQGDAVPGLLAPILFCGDTLFSAGCGRLFEGTPGQMFDSLARLAVEPGNAERAAYEVRCRELRAAELPTLPSAIGRERQINPFLRCDAPEVVAAARAQGATSSDPLAVFTALREWKNRFS